jgi:putative hemolysin
MFASFFTLIVLLFLSACFSASETAIFSLGIVRIRTLAQKGNKAAKILEKLRDNPKTLLGALLLGNNVVNMSAGALTTVVAIEQFGNTAVGIATGLITVAIIIFGEFLPKSFAAHHSEWLALALARPVDLLTRVLRPILVVINFLVDRIFRAAPPPTAPVFGEDEIKTMAQMGVKAGTLERGEKEMIERVFLFNDVTASDVMTPKEGVIFLDGKKSLADALPLIKSSEFSRYPVFENDKNNIVGTIHLKDIFIRIAENPTVSFSLIAMKDLAEPAAFVPHTKPSDDLLREMQRQHLHMAIVVNEYGSVLGVVTFEDLLEELVGEISDESDVDEHTVKRVDRLNVIAHGDVEIKDLNRFFNTKIQGPPHKSLGWVILKELGSIPTGGQQVKIADGLVATVEEILNLRINKVRLTKTDETLNAPPNDAQKKIG